MATASINKSGYRVVRAPGHPVAGKTGYALEHRVVLYDAIGPGEHRCHYGQRAGSTCAVTVAWGAEGNARLTVEHLDGDRTNNSLGNLRPCCASCNSQRFGGRPETQVVQDAKEAREQERKRFTEAYRPTIEAMVGDGYKMTDVAFLLNMTHAFLLPRDCWFPTATVERRSSFDGLDADTFDMLAELLIGDPRPFHEIVVDALLSRVASLQKASQEEATIAA